MMIARASSTTTTAIETASTGECSKQSQVFAYVTNSFLFIVATIVISEAVIAVETLSVEMTDATTTAKMHLVGKEAMKFEETSVRSKSRVARKA